MQPHKIPELWECQLLWTATRIFSEHYLDRIYVIPKYIWQSKLVVIKLNYWVQGCFVDTLTFSLAPLLLSLPLPPPVSPLFSPKYRVCCAVLDHCSDELSLSATRQVRVTVPPTDTVSSEVTGCKGSSSRSCFCHVRHTENSIFTLLLAVLIPGGNIWLFSC